MSDTPRILVVDDTAANVKLLASILRGSGYEVMSASSGRAGARRHG